MSNLVSDQRKYPFANIRQALFQNFSSSISYQFTKNRVLKNVFFYGQNSIFLFQKHQNCLQNLFQEALSSSIFHRKTPTLSLNLSQKSTNTKSLSCRNFSVRKAFFLSLPLTDRALRRASFQAQMPN